MRIKKTNNNQTLTITSSGKLMGGLILLPTLPFIFTGFSDMTVDSINFGLIAILMIFISIAIFLFFKKTELILDKTTNKAFIKRNSLLPNGKSQDEYDLDYILGARVVRSTSRDSEGSRSTTYGVHIDTKDDLDIEPIVTSSGRRSKEKIKNEINEWLGVREAHYRPSDITENYEKFD